jgi:hypothetical protein
MWNAFKRELLSHYIAMAELPWAKAHAWHQVNEFAKEYPALFGDLPDLLKAEMQKRKEPCSTTPTS